MIKKKVINIIILSSELNRYLLIDKAFFVNLCFAFFKVNAYMYLVGTVINS